MIDRADAPGKAGQGILIATLGGFVLSFDVLLIRLAHGDMWSVMALRCGMVCVTGLLIWALAPIFGFARLRFDWSAPAIAATLFYATSSALFIASSFFTSAANLVFIIAFTPGLSALAGWAMMGERPPWQTLLAIGVMVGGVGLIVQDGFTSGTTPGDFLALCVALCLTMAIIITRKHGLDMRLNVLMANGPTAMIGLTGAILGAGFHIDAPVWSIINGGIVIPLSFLCLSYAPLVLPGAVVAMFYLIETVLAPVWVWLAFDDAPSKAALVGGVILLAALMAHSMWLLVRSRRARNMVRPPRA